MFKQYLVDESEVNKRNITEFGYDFFSPYRVVERTLQDGKESFKIITSYTGNGAKSAAEELARSLNQDAKFEQMKAAPPKTIGEFLRRIQE